MPNAVSDGIGEAVARWEACESFARTEGGAPICSACGWLDSEHEQDARVTPFPARAEQRRRAPTRLAS